MCPPPNTAISRCIFWNQMWQLSSCLELSLMILQCCMYTCLGYLLHGDIILSHCCQSKCYHGKTSWGLCICSPIFCIPYLMVSCSHLLTHLPPPRRPQDWGRHWSPGLARSRFAVLVREPSVLLEESFPSCEMKQPLGYWDFVIWLKIIKLKRKPSPTCWNAQGKISLLIGLSVPYGFLFTGCSVENYFCR